VVINRSKLNTKKPVDEKQKAFQKGLGERGEVQLKNEYSLACRGSFSENVGNKGFLCKLGYGGGKGREEIKTALWKRKHIDHSKVAFPGSEKGRNGG